LASTLAELYTLSYAYGNASAKCVSSRTHLRETRTTCISKGSAYVGKRAACNRDLNALESASCLAAVKAEDRWKAYTSCYDDAVGQLNTLRPKINDTVESLKDQYNMAKLMECMAKAIDSSGSVSADKVKACKAKTFDIDTSLFNVSLRAELPAKVTFKSPTIYPGSQSYQKIVYDNLPQGVKVRPATPCLSWKSTCAAKSTFDNHQVYLKQHGKYCGYSSRGNRIDTFTCDKPMNKRTKFAFIHPSSDTTCKTAGLMEIYDGYSSYCEPLGGNLECYVSGRKAAVEVISNPDATGWTGKVEIRALMAFNDLTDKTREGTTQCEDNELFRTMSTTSDVVCRAYPETWWGTDDKKTNKASTKCTIEARQDGRCTCDGNQVMTGFKNIRKNVPKENSLSTTPGYDINIRCTELPGRLELGTSTWGETSSSTTSYNNKLLKGMSVEFGCKHGEVAVGMKVRSQNEWYVHAGNHPTHWTAKCASLRRSSSAKFDVEFAYPS